MDFFNVEVESTDQFLCVNNKSNLDQFNLHTTNVVIPTKTEALTTKSSSHFPKSKHSLLLIDKDDESLPINTLTLEEKQSVKLQLRETEFSSKSPLIFYSTSSIDDFDVNSIDQQQKELFGLSSLSRISSTQIEDRTNSDNMFNSEKEYEKGPFADEIISFLDPFFSETLAMFMRSEDHVLETVIQELKKYSKENGERTKKLMETINVKRLLIPYITLNLPGELILSYNELEEDDPQVILYQKHPLIAKEVRKLSVFLDRYDTNKEVLCLLVWSKVDKVLVNLPSIGLNPYPLCWCCLKTFGLFTCKRCGVAKYCSRECQKDQWSSHKKVCSEMESYGKEHKILVLD